VEEALVGVGCEAHEVLMVGDSIARDLVAGRRAGLATAWISPLATVPATSAAMVDFHVPSLLDLANAMNDARDERS
jgi:FMN phosphatase YigB (HAD superfamily)